MAVLCMILTYVWELFSALHTCPLYALPCFQRIPRKPVWELNPNKVLRVASGRRQDQC